MTNSRAFFRNHPVLTYFALTCTISWGALILYIMVQGGIPETQEEFLTQMPLLIPAVLGGPSLGAILAIALVSGRAGFRELFARLSHWRVGGRWYAVALLSAPLVFIAVHVVLSTVSPVFRPGIITAGNRMPVLLMGIAGGITVGFFEEVGWTGFAIPLLRQRYGITAAGLRLGFMWAVWHLPFQRWWPGVALSGELPISAFLIATSVLFLIGELVAYRILMVWVYQLTSSLPIAILMHTSLTACSLIIGPAVISGSSLLVYDVALAAGWWLVVAVVVVAGRRTAQEVKNHKPAQGRSLAGV